MAERRMFTMKIVDSDAFLDMPLSTHALYFHLSMRADDDGFVNNPRKIQRMIGASDDDLRLLLAKRFILGFENGVVVIKHWRMHNLLRKDRYNPTQYIEEKSTLEIKEDGAYTEKEDGNLLATTWQPNGNHLATQDRLGKDRIVKDSIGECISAEPTPAPKKPIKHKRGEYNHVLLTEDQEQKLFDEYGEILTAKAIVFLDEYIEMKGYKAKNHYLAIRKWVIDAVKEREAKNPQSKGSFDTDDFFNAAVERALGYADEPKTAGNDEEIRQRAEALKQKLV
jgi:hypothetical protein